MDFTTVLVFLALSVLILYLLTPRREKKYRLPPMAEGNVLWGHSFHNWCSNSYLEKLSKQYKGIFRLKVFGQHVIVLNSYETIKESFTAEWSTGRPQSPFLKEFTANGHGIVLNDGLIWRVHRRFALSVLRDLGFGKSKIVASIQHEVECLRKRFAELSGRPILADRVFARAVMNVISGLVFGEYCGEDPQFERLVDSMRNLVAGNTQASFFLALWPLIKRLPIDCTGLKKLAALRADMMKYIFLKYREHMATFNESDIRDYIDAYLVEMRSAKEDCSTFTETQLAQAILDLYVAGTETTSTTLLWAFLLFIKYPEVQRKVYQEIESTIGCSKLPEISDRSKLRYTDAVLHEIQRYVTFFAHGIPHRAIEDGQVSGYDIPKDSLIVSDTYSAHRDDKLWKDPYHFNPDNFLDEKGNLVNCNYMLLFSTGKRVCLGESLAKQEMFLIIVGLLQQFEFEEDPSKPLPSETDRDEGAFVQSPRSYHFIAQLRDKN